MVHTEQNIIFMSRFAVLWVEFEEKQINSFLIK
jgi:hypothetical protein